MHFPPTLSIQAHDIAQIAVMPCTGTRMRSMTMLAPPVPTSRVPVRPLASRLPRLQAMQQSWSHSIPPKRRRSRATTAPPTARAAESTTTSITTRHGIVITGGTRGVGFALAREFLAAGDSVLICGRDPERLQAALGTLQCDFGAGRVAGAQCDVSDPGAVERLGRRAREHLGTITIWINNAGEVTAKRLLADVEPSELVQVVGTNVLGSLLGSREAIRLMRQQLGSDAAPPRYHIYNLGFSTFGAQFSKSAVTHKSTKMALKQLNESLAEELVAEGLPGIGVHNLSPGMVLTDLLLRDSTPTARRFFNALAEEPETVAAALVPRIRAAAAPSGGSLDYMSPGDAFLRILRGLPQVLRGGRHFDAAGERVPAAGKRYAPNGVRQQY